jgi:hypothetical protein
VTNEAVIQTDPMLNIAAAASRTDMQIAVRKTFVPDVARE